MTDTEPRVQQPVMGHSSKGLWGRKAQLMRGSVYLIDHNYEKDF